MAYAAKILQDKSAFLSIFKKNRAPRRRMTVGNPVE